MSCAKTLQQMVAQQRILLIVITFSSLVFANAQSSSSNSSSTPSGGDVVIDESSQNAEDNPQRIATVVCSLIAGVIIFLSLKWARIRFLARLQEEEDLKNGKVTDGLSAVACEACEKVSNSILADSRIPIQAQLQMLTLRQNTRSVSASVNPIESESEPTKRNEQIENL